MWETIVVSLNSLFLKCRKTKQINETTATKQTNKQTINGEREIDKAAQGFKAD